jgi:hypothetical protein
MKGDHERWVRESLQDFDAGKQRDEEHYAHLIQEFCERVDLDNWQKWSSWVLSGGGYPRIWKYMHARLDLLREWLLSRVWPRRYTEIEDSLENFRLVLEDFLNVFDEHAEPLGEDMLGTRKFYKIEEWDPERYERLSRLHEFHVDLVQDLMLELTRAANYVCDKVRDRLFPTFRLTEGLLLVTHGPYMNMSYRTQRCEYRNDERTASPYPGLEGFKSIRYQRDHCFGHGTQPKARRTEEN